ncbi:hypothetical protein [Flavitalea sp.]|nr:hypothetical protein [Flavitalea sp.]
MSRRLLTTLEILFIVFLACVPLFATFPYRVNIFLSWEGAYRISEGHLPFRDFGTPLGGMFWVIPGIFFKIFGAQMISLIKAQVFINIIAGLSFRSILKSLNIQEGIRFISVVLFCLSYSFMNFWPWYNHTVIVYELVALAFLIRYIAFSKLATNPKYRFMLLVASAIFVLFSFFTKQDGGGMAFAICIALLIYHAIYEKDWKSLLIFIGSFVLLMTIVVAWLSSYEFAYWFNHGQAPHSARISIREIADDFFNSSQWIKFYLFLIGLLILSSFKNWKEFYSNKTEGVFLLLTLAMLGEAAVFQVTSYTPPDNNIFFHSFAFVYIISLLGRTTSLNFLNRKTILVCFTGMMLWWSGTYWKYIQRIVERAMPAGEIATVSQTGENIVNRKTYMINKGDSLDIPMSQWVYTGLKSFDKIYMPKPTVDGIHRLLNMDLVKNSKSLKVLNMSELTPLAAEMPYELEKNESYPLWYHLGVGMFNREAEMFEKRIAEKYYDLVLFENIETLNNFYPFRIRVSLKKHYNLADSFLAPRRGNTQGEIEVYRK